MATMTTFKNDQEKKVSVSLCTPCMNRLPILKKTLLKNLEQTLPFKNVETLVLDYNSTDGLEKWIKKEAREFIESGKLVCYQLINPNHKYFSHPHSRNILFRLSKSELLCNINTDYLINQGFLEYISCFFEHDRRVALIPDMSKVERDNYGRLCVLQSDFVNVGGYDELFQGYGYEDTDLCLRLGMSGVNLQFIENNFCCEYVNHTDDLRIKNMYDYHNVTKILVRKLEPDKTEIYFFFKDKKVEFGLLHKSINDIPTLAGGKWNCGNIVKQTNKLVVICPQHPESQIIEFIKRDNCYLNKNEIKPFVVIKDESQKHKILFKKSQILNCQYLKSRLQTGQWKVNPYGFGRGIVLKNFEEKIDLIN